MNRNYCIARDYSRNLGARYISQGAYSGEDFREKVLRPFFEAKSQSDTLTIDLDGLNGYPSSFFEEAFGGIARVYIPAQVREALKFICNDNPLFVDDIISYINQEHTVQ